MRSLPGVRAGYFPYLGERICSLATVPLTVAGRSIQQSSMGERHSSEGPRKPDNRSAKHGYVFQNFSTLNMPVSCNADMNQPCNISSRIPDNPMGMFG